MTDFHLGLFTGSIITLAGVTAWSIAWNFCCGEEPEACQWWWHKQWNLPEMHK